MKILLLLPLLLGLMSPAIAHNGPNTPGWEPPSAGNSASGALRADEVTGNAERASGADEEKPDFEGDLDL